MVNHDILKDDLIFSKFSSVFSSLSKIKSMISLEAEGKIPVVLSNDAYAQNVHVNESLLLKHHNLLESFKDSELSNITLVDLLGTFYHIADTLLQNPVKHAKSAYFYRNGL